MGNDRQSKETLILKRPHEEKAACIERYFASRVRKFLAKSLGEDNVVQTHGHRLVVQNKKGERAIIIVSPTQTAMPAKVA
jgi:hypothetical protein